MNEQKTEWKLVPVPATDEMIAAIEAKIDAQLTASGIAPGDMHRQDGDAIYAAAMDAAPDAVPGMPSAARDAALDEAASVCENVLDATRPNTTSAYAYFHATAIRALKSVAGPVADAAADKDGQKPIAWLRFWAAQHYAGHGDIECDEGYEVCKEGDKGADGSPAFPVFDRPAPASARQKIIERAIIGLRDGWATRIDADAALAALSTTPAPVQQAAPSGWQPIETAPKDGLTLLLGSFDTFDNWRTMRGQWFSQSEIDEEWEDPDGNEEGWFETAFVPDPPNCWSIAPTHWMPLPPAPAAAPAQPVGLSDIEERTEKIRLAHASPHTRSKAQLFRDVEYLLSHIAVLRSVPVGLSEQGSIDTEEFHKLLADFMRAFNLEHGFSLKEARRALVAHIDAAKIGEQDKLDAARWQWLESVHFSVEFDGGDDMPYIATSLAYQGLDTDFVTWVRSKIDAAILAAGQKSGA